MPQSLQCPRCNGSVTVADQAAGQRVKCPHCDQTFLAPGFSSTTNDDDDWLTLDDVPASKGPEPVEPAEPVESLGSVESAGPPAATGPSNRKSSDPVPPSTGSDAIDTDPIDIDAVEVGAEDLFLDTPPFEEVSLPDKPSSPSSSGPTISPEEEALLADFTSDLDDFTAEIETPPPPPAAAPKAPQVGAGGKRSPLKAPAKAAGATGAPAPGAKPASNPVAAPVEYANEYRVTCHVCGSFVYAKAAQAGKTIKCSDCYSPMTVPPPPKVRKGVQVNIDEAESFSFEPNVKAERRPDPYQKSAEDLLDEASREETAVDGPTYDDTPSVVEWLKGIFGPFKDLGVLVHLAGLAVLACVPTVIVLSLDSPILVLGLFPAGFFLALLTVSCGLAILQSVANEEATVSNWPTLDPMSWMGQLFVVAAAAMAAALPIWIVCILIIGPQLLSVAVTMFAIYVFFPFVLLSMLDMNSPFVPFSSEVARSVTKCEEAWGGFYFSSGILFIGLFLIFGYATSALSPSAAAILAIVSGIAATFMYFGMIGRLAYSIGQVVNAPPRKDEIDRTRPSDAE